MASERGADLRQVVVQVLSEVSTQEGRHPQGFPGDRNGIRAAIAAIEDETAEALEGWRSEKKLPEGRLPDHQWTHTREELVQVAAVTLRALVAMPAPCNCLDAGPGHEEGCPRYGEGESEWSYWLAQLNPEENPHV